MASGPPAHRDMSRQPTAADEPSEPTIRIKEELPATTQWLLHPPIESQLLPSAASASASSSLSASASLTSWSSSNRARFPQGPHDWDSAMPIIRELYMVQNLALPKVIEVMATNHGFKATARMYKSRFPKWGWTKNEKRKPSSKTEIKKKSHYSQSSSSSSSPSKNVTEALPDLPLASPASRMLLHQNCYARHLDVSCRAFDAFIASWAANDARWRVERIDKGMKVQDLPGYIDLAVGHFESGNFAPGGKFLRLAFLEVENCIKDDHLLNIAGMLSEHAIPLTKFPGIHGNEILEAFGKYVYQHALFYWGNHPITVMFRGLLEAARNGADYTLSWMKSLFRLRVDKLRSLRGHDATTLGAYALYLTSFPDANMAESYARHQQEYIERVSRIVGAGHMDILRSRVSLYRLELIYRPIDDGALGERIEDLCATTRARFRRSSNYDPDDVWTRTKQQNLYRGSHLLLAMYWAAQADVARTVTACWDAVYLDCEPAPPWGSYVVAVMEVLQEHGLHEEARRIDAWRSSVELTPSLVSRLEEKGEEGDEGQAPLEDALGSDT